ncbi:uncharacterized protein LOC18448957 [Amborella trichopoda]|uniref:Uncharacterized protein n=1 Tax=Amborella trichopoda TaxID=13333 RepID=U5DDE0_AMBTC|nr:uncharacterized protein LOC18448957 [Amborella trichopoda]ERN20539.1 hypothetical protein AMTR_s00068p00201560 [Amborella trichopoda]|eukprot:XP_006859072.1 uncharacterized protein LOC18448957 [Amborella trichopoda]
MLSSTANFSSILAPKVLSSTAHKRPFVCLKFGIEEIKEISQNKVLVSATVAAAIGQFSKPFTSAIYGKGFDFAAAARSGGMPSTHSAGVVAAAAAIGLERGFSDSIFGLAVVLAAIVVYDSQGVRKEVGTHAKILNNTILKSEAQHGFLETENGDLADEDLEAASVEAGATISSLFSSTNDFYTKDEKRAKLNSNYSQINKPSDVLRKSLKMPLIEEAGKEAKKIGNRYPRLKESVGHTEAEVFVGILLGFLVTWAVYSVM